MAFWSDVVLSSIASAAAGAALPYAVKRVHALGHRRANRRFWCNDTPTLSVVYNIWNAERAHEPEPVVNFAVAYALGGYLPQLGGFADVHLFTDRDGESVPRKGNLLLVGGPLSNSLTREFMDLLSPRYRFRAAGPDAREIVDTQGTARFTPQFDATAAQTYDVGWFIRAPNPKSSMHVVVVAYGTYGIGTQAVLRFLMDVANLRKLSLRGHEAVEGVVGAKVAMGRIVSTELLTTPHHR